jgi:hypothetical protein
MKGMISRGSVRDSKDSLKVMRIFTITHSPFDGAPLWLAIATAVAV